MRKLLTLLLVAALVCGCSPPLRIRGALETQARYTRVYVEATLPLLRQSDLANIEELEGIGRRLIRNSEILQEWGAKCGGNGEETRQKSGETGSNERKSRDKVQSLHMGTRLETRSTKGLQSLPITEGQKRVPHSCSMELGTGKRKGKGKGIVRSFRIVFLTQQVPGCGAERLERAILSSF